MLRPSIIKSRAELDALTKGRDAAARRRRSARKRRRAAIDRRGLAGVGGIASCRAPVSNGIARGQDPMIARASTLFAMATANAFAGLGIDYGDEDQPVLVARRADRARACRLQDREGTRDQLFPALRFAFVERRTRTDAVYRRRLADEL